MPFNAFKTKVKVNLCLLLIIIYKFFLFKVTDKFSKLPFMLTVNFELPTFSVELRADLGEGERSLVELSFREFKLNYQKIHPFENMLQVSNFYLS